MTDVHRVPSVSLKALFDDRQFVVRPSRGARVLVAVHEFDCAECIRYVQQIVSIREELAACPGDVVIVGPMFIGVSATGFGGLGVPVLEDPDHLLTNGRLTVLIIDEWGEIYFASQSENLHGAIATEDVSEWVKFVAIQCPEC